MAEVVDAGDGERRCPAADQLVPVREQARAGALDDPAHQVGIDPVVVIAEHGHAAVAGAEPRDDSVQAVEIAAGVAHEVPPQGDEIGCQVGHAIRHAREPALGDGGPVMQIRHEGDAVANEPRVQAGHREGDLGTRGTMSYTKCPPNAMSSRLTRSSFPWTPRDSVWLSGNGDSP